MSDEVGNPGYHPDDDATNHELAPEAAQDERSRTAQVRAELAGVLEEMQATKERMVNLRELLRDSGYEGKELGQDLAFARDAFRQLQVEEQGLQRALQGLENEDANG